MCVCLQKFVLVCDWAHLVNNDWLIKNILYFVRPSRQGFFVVAEFGVICV